MLPPLTDLVSECREMKATKRTGTKKRPWYWDESHQKSFDNIKNTVKRDIMLAYPDYSQPFSIYTDASTRQLGTVVVQNNRPISLLVVN